MGLELRQSQSYLTSHICPRLNCPKLDTVGRTRSFIATFKVLTCVIPGCFSILAPLDNAIAGCKFKEKILWLDNLHTPFCNAQVAHTFACTITLPRPDDQLWIVTNGAVPNPGIHVGATLYVTWDSKLHHAGFFSAKRQVAQTSWLPCEVEALAIAAAITHFSPYLILSDHKACILTDSKACVQANGKPFYGEYLVSPCVSTFLSTVS